MSATATHIYVAGFSDDIIKVGRTANPSMRLYQHHLGARHRDEALSNWWVQPHDNANEAERALREVGKSYFSRAWGNEYYVAAFTDFMDTLSALSFDFDELADLEFPAASWDEAA